jgi:tetratricopeptide (TPR) repeat protein
MRHACQFAAIGFAVAIGLAPCAVAADDSLASLPPSSIAEQSRSIQRAGELALRRGDFDAARQAFSRAAALQPSYARAWWGLGRVEKLHFRRDAARDFFAAAYRLDPRDPEIILSYLDYVTDPASRAVLLRNVVYLARAAMPRHAELAATRLAVEKRLEGREAGALASGYRGYRLHLAGFRPSGASEHGLLVTARINGGRPLRLLLDTGARGLLIRKAAARDLGLEPIVESQVGGLGDGSAVESTLSLARRVAFDDLEFRDCLVEVSGEAPARGVDGIVGPSLFERFVVRIDGRERELELMPRGGEESLANGSHVLDLDRLLLVRARMGSGKEGWFLLDTGAAFTAISAKEAPAALRAGSADVAGMQGAAMANRLSPVALQVAGKSLADPEAIALDLGRLSEREGVEIAGILGWSAVGRWPMTIDFRTGSVSLGR